MSFIEKIFQDNIDGLDRRILEESRQTFLKYGYAGANVDHIAKNLGIGKGTIYRHFASKPMLFLSVVVYTYREMVPHFAHIPSIEDPALAFRVYLETLFTLSLKLNKFFMLLNPVEFGREFHNDCSSKPELKTIVERFQNERKSGLQLLSQIIANLQEKKIIQSPVASDTLALMIFILTNQYFYHASAQDSQKLDVPFEHTQGDLFHFIYHAIEYKEAHQ